jgi:phosphomannomutase
VDEGVDILNIGMAGTEEMYSATYQFKACAGVEITASHNPIKYNGMKIVKSCARPLHPLTEFKKIKSVAEKNSFIQKK